MKSFITASLLVLAAACGGKKAAATDTTPPAPVADDGVAECVRTCVEDATPEGGSSDAETLEDACREQCGGLEPGPEALDGYDAGTGAGAE